MFIYICFVFSFNIGQNDSEPVQTHKYALTTLEIPNEGDLIVLIITAVISPQKFYAQIPLGPNVLMALEALKNGGLYTIFNFGVLLLQSAMYVLL